MAEPRDPLMDMNDEDTEAEGGYYSGGEVDAVADTIGEFLDTASVDRVYGEAVTQGDTTVIPAAEVLVGLGFGVGAGSGPAESGKGTGGGGGGGGGGKTFSRPVAVVVISPAGVRVEPVIDLTKIGLAAVTAFGFAIALMMKMKRPHRMMMMRGMWHHKPRHGKHKMPHLP